MKTCNHLLRAGVFALLVLLGSSGVLCAQGRINQYTIQTSFPGAGQWNDLSTSGSSTYLADEIHGYSQQDENGNNISTSLPFNFKYDNATISSGSSIYIGAGAISFQSTPPAGVQYGGLASSSYPGDIFVWGGAYTNAGSGYNQGETYYGIYSETDGSAPNRVFTIQWTDVHSSFYSGAGGNNYDGSYSTDFLCSMQVKFYEGSNEIQMFYQNHNQDLGGYGDPNNPYYYDTYYQSAIGLNGFTSPSFSSLTYATSIYSTPSTDLQFSPPAPPQELSLEPKTLNFGTTTPQLPVTMCVTATSAGGAGSTLHITGYNLSGSSAYTMISGPPVGTAIPVGSSVQYCFQFQPFSNGQLTAAFTLTTDGVDSGKQVVSLTGVGATPEVSYTPSSLFRGVNTEVSDTSTPQYVYVHSTGGGPLTIDSTYFIGLNPEDYQVTRLPGIIPPGGVDSIGIIFTPTLEGTPDAHLIIASTAVNNPSDTVSLFGVGILPHLLIDSTYPNPVTVNFDSVALGADSCMAITLSNPGSDTLAIERNYLAGSDFDFTLQPLTGTDTLIPPGASRTLTVCFTPLQRGTRVGTLRIFTNIPFTEANPRMDTSQFAVNLVGKGVPTGNFFITGPMTNGDTSVGATICVIDTFWNKGEADVTVTSASIAGTNASEFVGSYPTFPFVLRAGTFKTFTVCATPGDTGVRNAILTGNANFSGTPLTSSLQLSVTGISTRDSLAFSQPFSETVCIGDTGVGTVTVTNLGSVPVSYSSIIGGTNSGDFTIVSATGNPVQPGGTETIQIHFVPTTNALETATLTIGGGAGGSIALSSTGGAATISGTGTAAITPVGSIDTFSATVMNSGTCNWTPGDVSVQAPFAYVSGGSTSIPAGSNGTLMFSFAPTATGTFSSPVTFTNSVGTSIPAANVMVQGTAGTDAVGLPSAQSGFALSQNTPNPAHGLSQIQITVPVPSQVRLEVLDVTGKLVETLLDQHFDAGMYNVALDASQLSSGTYYYQLTSELVTLSRQMVVIK